MVGAEYLHVDSRNAMVGVVCGDILCCVGCTDLAGGVGTGYIGRITVLRVYQSIDAAVVGETTGKMIE